MSIFLETQRLIIKPSALEDFDDLYTVQSDPDVMQYIGQGVRSKKEVQESLKKIIAHYQKHGFSLGSVFEKNSGLLIGQAGLFYLGFNELQADIEVSYRLKKQYWGMGYATELTKALITWGFNNLTIDKLIAVVRPENKGSRKVLEKSGMDYAGNTNYQGKDVLKFEIYKNVLINS
jgi:ribosomal-protein-alanine N-acetyltransferase